MKAPSFPPPPSSEVFSSSTLFYRNHRNCDRSNIHLSYHALNIKQTQQQRCNNVNNNNVNNGERPSDPSLLSEDWANTALRIHRHNRSLARPPIKRERERGRERESERSDRPSARLVAFSSQYAARRGKRGSANERESPPPSSSPASPSLPSLPRRRGTKTAQRRRRPTHYNARPVSWTRAECNASFRRRSRVAQETRGEGPSSLERAERRGRRLRPSGPPARRPSVRSQQKGPSINDISRGR